MARLEVMLVSLPTTLASESEDDSDKHWNYVSRIGKAMIPEGGRNNFIIHLFYFHFMYYHDGMETTILSNLGKVPHARVKQLF